MIDGIPDQWTDEPLHQCDHGNAKQYLSARRRKVRLERWNENAVRSKGAAVGNKVDQKARGYDAHAPKAMRGFSSDRGGVGAHRRAIIHPLL